MSFLRSFGFGDIVFWLLRQVFVAVLRFDMVTRSKKCFFCQIQAIGSHIGDDTHGALVCLDSLVELLGHHHRFFR